MHRIFCFLLFLATATLAQDKPNIVLIFADDLGVNDLGCYGRTEHRTPNLDRLAAEGMRFTSAYCALPICSASRAGLLTGKNPARLHLTNYLPGRADAPSQKLLQPRIEGQLPLEEFTVAEILKKGGYATGLFGKWHLGGQGFGPAEQGFDTVFMPKGNTPPSATEGGKGEYAITESAIKFITENKDRPFFCYVPHNTPHIPLGAQPARVAEKKDAFQPTYAAMIETLDDTVGKLLKHLDDLKLTERTIVIFTSDNGGLHVLEGADGPATHNTPFRAGKGYLYEGGLREPLIVRWPGRVPAAKVCETPVILLDLMPTLMKAAGQDPGKTTGPLDGVDITGLLTGGNLPGRPLFWHYPHYTNQGSRPAAAMRDGQWKLIVNDEDDSAELYDLAADVSETTDLSQKEPARVTEMRKQLEAWRTRIGAQRCTPNPAYDAAAAASLYKDRDTTKLRVSAGQTAATIGPDWKAWRAAMNAAVKDRQPALVPAEGVISLHARNATVHAEKMRYEEQTYKNVLGFWVRVEDWAEWNFETTAAGRYTLDILQGCGKGSAGAQVEFILDGNPIPHIVVETGHFQFFARIALKTVDLPAGKHTLAVKPKTKPGAAVMDLREVRLIPEP